MMVDSLERNHRSAWLPQFGLYKYESAENLENEPIHKPLRSTRGFKSGFLFLLGVLLTLFLITYFIIADLSRTERIGVVPPKDVDAENYSAEVVEMPNPLKNDLHSIFSREISVEENISLLNNSEITIAPDNHKKTYSVEPQKLVFLPSRYLKPPKMDVPVSKKRSERRNQAPLPFNHYIQDGRHPVPFKKLPTRRFSNGFRQPQILQDGFRPIVGSYRRAKANPARYYQASPSNQHPFYVTPAQPSTTSQVFIADPFHKYKPPAASDVNMLVADYPSREEHKKLYTEQYLKNAHSLYQQVVKASKQKMKKLSSNEKQRPFQLMLDVYPMTEEPPTRIPGSQIRFSPDAAKYNAMNSIDHDKNYNGEYFNRIRFAQLQANNVYPKYPADHEPSGSEINHVFTGVERPSQLVVHLNLFPKKKKVKNMSLNYRKRRPLMNFSGSEENSSEYLRRASVESDEMYSSNEGDMIMMDKKSISSKKKVTIKPIAINFNFPANCSQPTNVPTKIVPMMDANDQDVQYAATNDVPKAHDFPYRFASMPPPYIKQTRPLKPPFKFQHRMLEVETTTVVTTNETTHSI